MRRLRRRANSNLTLLFSSISTGSRDTAIDLKTLLDMGGREKASRKGRLSYRAAKSTRKYTRIMKYSSRDTKDFSCSSVLHLSASCIKRELSECALSSFPAEAESNILRKRKKKQRERERQLSKRLHWLGSSSACRVSLSLRARGYVMPSTIEIKMKIE